MLLVLIGGITFTGSIVAFLKLAGRVSSRPVYIPAKHFVNSSLLATNIVSMGAFITMAPSAPLVAAGFLGANTVLSFIKGFTTTAAIGGADMRERYTRHRQIAQRITNIVTPDSCGHHCVKRVLRVCSGRGRYRTKIV